MKRILIICMAALLGCLSVSAQQFALIEGPKEPGEVRVLCIGNSFTYVCHADSMLTEIAASQGMRVRIGKYLHGGRTFGQHLEIARSRQAVEAGGYDYAFLQDQSSTPAKYALTGDRTILDNFITLKDNVLKASPGCTVFLERTWTYPNLRSGNAEVFGSADSLDACLRRGCRMMAKEAGTNVSPIGDAFVLAGKKYPDIQLLAKDNHHQNLAGSYLKACVNYLLISKKPFRGEPATCGVDPEQAARLRSIAEEVVLMASSLPARGQVTVYPEIETGPIKMMNAANNYTSSDILTQSLEVPYMRTHDCEVVDIQSVFPDFTKDPDDPASYQFHHADLYMKSLVACNSKPYFRLGQSAESGSNRLGPVPPPDFKKWAVICEHVIRHYNEGWADGFHMGIEYWEIWNEPNMDSRKYGKEGKWKDPSFWGGTDEDYFRLYTTTAKYLKKKFPRIKVGGPAFAGSYDQAWIDDFLQYVIKEKAPLDFFTYHKYASHPETLVQLTRDMREHLKKNGFNNIDIHLGEWNYVKDWSSDGQEYSARIRHEIKGAAFVAATMSALQLEDVQMLNYYDLRSTTSYNGAFGRSGQRPEPRSPYYALLSWAKLARLGTSVKVDLGKHTDIFVTAAKSKEGKLGILVTRYNDDETRFERERVEVSVPGYDLTKATCHMTSDNFLFTEFPLTVKDGKIVFYLKTNCFAFVEVAP